MECHKGFDHCSIVFVVMFQVFFPVAEIRVSPRCFFNHSSDHKT